MGDVPVKLDLDLRLVRYFIVVAEQRRFVSAAAQLHITQPSLSRQIRSLEKQLGVRLFNRTAHGSRLTDAGEAFLPHAIALLRSATGAAAAVPASPRQHPGNRLGAAPAALAPLHRLPRRRLLLRAV